MPIQFRTVLVQDDFDNPTDRIVQEPDGGLSHDALFSDKPWETTPLQEQDVGDIRALLYADEATLEEKSMAIPVVKSLAKGEAPKAQDLAQVTDALESVNSRNHRRNLRSP